MALLLMSMALALGAAFSMSAAEDQGSPELEAAADQEDLSSVSELSLNKPGRLSSFGAQIVDASGAVSDAIVRRNRPLPQSRHSILEPDGPLSLAITDELLNSVLSHLSIEPEGWRLQQQHHEESKPNRPTAAVQMVENGGRGERRLDRANEEPRQGSIVSERFAELADLAAINHREAEEHRIFVQTSVYLLFILLLLGSAGFAGYVAAKTYQDEEKEDSWLLDINLGGLLGYRNIELMVQHSKELTRLSECKKSIKRPDVSGLLYKPGLATRVW